MLALPLSDSGLFPMVFELLVGILDILRPAHFVWQLPLQPAQFPVELQLLAGVPPPKFLGAPPLIRLLGARRLLLPQVVPLRVAPPAPVAQELAPLLPWRSVFVGSIRGCISRRGR